MRIELKSKHNRFIKYNFPVYLGEYKNGLYDCSVCVGIDVNGNEIRLNMPFYEKEFEPYDYFKIREGDEVEIRDEKLIKSLGDHYKPDSRIKVLYKDEHGFIFLINDYKFYVDFLYENEKIFLKKFQIGDEVCLHKDTEYYSKLINDKKLCQIKVIGVELMPGWNPMCEDVNCRFDETVYKIRYLNDGVAVDEDWVHVGEIYRKV